MSSIPSHSDIKEKQPGKTWTVLNEDDGAFNITLPLGFGKMSKPVVQSNSVVQDLNFNLSMLPNIMMPIHLNNNHLSLSVGHVSYLYLVYFHDF